jgi:hypothetical protein
VLALACYNRKVHNEISLMESQTLVQVGTGGHELLEASHSAILTNLNLGFSRDLLFELARKPEPEFLDSKNKLLDLARSYGLDVEVVSANLSKEMIHSLKKNDPRLNQFVRPLIPYESDFGQNLSATVKLPKYCNQLDFQCEEALRARLTEELNNCYKGTVTPCCVYNFFVHGLIEALLSEKTKILEDLAKHDIQQKTIRDLEVVSKVSNKEILSEERLTKITLVVGRAFESHLHPTKEFMHAYSQLINDSISALKQDLYETIPGAKEFLETPFKDLHKISDLKIAPVLRMIRSYLIKLIPLDWQKHVNLDWPQSLNFLEDTEYLFEEKCNLDLAKLGYEWISKSILTSLRTKRICLASKTLPISSLFDVIDKIFKSNQTLFLLPKDDYSLRQKNDLIDLYLKLLQDAPNLLALLSSKSVEGELGAVKREPLSLDDYKEYQENLTKSRHDLSILNTQVFLPPADYLHEIIYYRIQRVEDDARYPQGLKIILDKPKYLKNPYFRKCFSEHLKERNMEKLSLKLGGMVEGYLWI